MVDGLDVRAEPLAARQRIGFLPQEAPLSLELTIEEYLRFCAALRRVAASEIDDAVDFVIRRCGLAPMRRRLIGNLSGGYRQRVGIAQALVHTPRVIVLDEPTVGLDPNQILGVRELIREIGEEHTVIFSTHILPEVEALCREVLMIEQGEVVFHDEMETFRTVAAPHTVMLVCRTPPDPAVFGTVHTEISGVERLSPRRFRLHPDGDRTVTQVLIEKGQSEGWGLEEISFERSSLEGVFNVLSQGPSV